MEAKKKQINIMFYTLVIISFISLFVIPGIVHAADYDINSGFLATELDQITSGINKSVNDVLALGALDQLASDDIGTMSTVLKNLYDMLIVIGGMWCIIVAMGHLITNIDKGQDPVECVFKVLLELGITFVFLMNLGEIIGAISQLGAEITRAIGESMDPIEVETTKTDLVIALTGSDHGGFGWEFKAMCALLVPYLLSYVLSILAVLALVQTIIEIAIRRAFAPMAVADIYQEGLRSPGVRYLKKILAGFLKLAICVLACNIIPALCGSMASSGEPFKQVAYLIAINASCVGVMFKTGEYANDIVGA